MRSKMDCSISAAQGSRGRSRTHKSSCEGYPAAEVSALWRRTVRYSSVLQRILLLECFTLLLDARQWCVLLLQHCCPRRASPAAERCVRVRQVGGRRLGGSTRSGTVCVCVCMCVCVRVCACVCSGGGAEGRVTETTAMGFVGHAYLVGQMTEYLSQEYQIPFVRHSTLRGLCARGRGLPARALKLDHVELAEGLVDVRVTEELVPARPKPIHRLRMRLRL
jgi:hypothetical protein